MEAGSDCCKLVKASEEYKEEMQEVAVGLAAAEETSVVLFELDGIFTLKEEQRMALKGKDVLLYPQLAFAKSFSSTPRCIAVHPVGSDTCLKSPLATLPHWKYHI